MDDPTIFDWHREQGFVWDPTRVDLLRKQPGGGGGGRAAVALQRCEEGTALARIPLRGCITRHTASPRARRLLARMEEIRRAQADLR